MLRTIFTIGALAVLGLFLLSSVFGILKGLIGLALFLLGLAIRIAIVGLIVYLVIRIVSPETARRLRERWSGPTG
jgi:sorbitol-specific phosphotransferase system component IIC